MTNNIDKLNTEIPQRAGYEFPSVQTENQLAVALESDDIEQVKGQLKHVWGHYEMLELLVASSDNAPEAIIGALQKLYGDDFDSLTPAEVATAVARLYATELVDYAYESAHHNGMMAALLGFTVPDATRAGFTGLDFGDLSQPEDEDDILARLDPDNGN